MIHEKIKLQVEGSADYAAMYTYFLNLSPEIPVSKRPTIVVCPGGGYVDRAEGHEGADICEYYNSLGINAFMLKYRVSPYRYPAELYDIQRAVRFVRYNAEKFNVDPEKIGVMGFPQAVILPLWV